MTLPESPCPKCGYNMDQSLGLDGAAAPKPGDVSICFNCGRFLQFDDELRLVDVTQKTLDDLTPHQRRILIKAADHIEARGPIPREEPT